MKYLIAVVLSALSISHAYAWGDYGPRPIKWCGFWMRQQMWSDPGIAYNKADKWVNYGTRARGPAPGVIGVERHHVFKVVEVVDKHTVLAISGNDNHAVRTRLRSIRKVIAWRNP